LPASARLPGLDAAEDRTFDSAGVTIRYVERGRGEPVVLVHSYAGDLESQWIATGVFGVLSGSYRAIAFDGRGHGRSGKPHDASAYGAEMSRDIVRLLDHLGIDRAHVVGYSMGAHLVAQLLTLAPERFITATLGGGTGRRRWTADDERQAQLEADEMERGSLASQMRRLWPAGEPPPGDELIERSSAAFLPGKDCRALAAVRRSNRDQVITDGALAAVRVPVLGIVGSEDPYRTSFDELRKLLPQLELAVIEGAAHADAAGRPEFAAAIERFVRARAALKTGRTPRHTAPP
jgi:pimeloyl-ACP methyl ester carboxylesterase